MILNTPEKRYELVAQMLDEAINLEKEFDSLEDDNDWGGVTVAWENLLAIEDLILTEEIFLDALDDMRAVRTHDRDEKEEYMGIFLIDGLHVFNREVILPRLKHMRDVLSNWGFKTERGKAFGKDVCEKLTALIIEYYNLYDI